MDSFAKGIWSPHVADDQSPRLQFVNVGLNALVNDVTLEVNDAHDTTASTSRLIRDWSKVCV